MNLYDYFKTIKRPADHSDISDGANTETYVIVFCQETNKFSTQSCTEANLDVNQALELFAKDESFSWNGKNCNLLVIGSRKKVDKEYRSFLKIARDVEREARRGVKDKEVAKVLRLKADFQVSLDKKRQNLEWIKLVNSFTLPGISEDIMKGIQRTLLQGSKIHGRLVTKVATLLFGEQKLMRYRLMVPSSKSIAVKANQRPKMFSLRDEENLKSILVEIDSCILTVDGWYYLVVKPINQLGLNLKRKVTKKKEEKKKDEVKKEPEEEIILDSQASTSNDNTCQHDCNYNQESDDEDLDLEEIGSSEYDSSEDSGDDDTDSDCVITYP